jgi:hypothetical protein
MPLPPNNISSIGPRPATLIACAAAAGALALAWFRFNAAPPRRGYLFPADFVNYYLPRGEGVAQRLLAGELPLWNPRLCTGVPELATLQSAALSPLTWLFAPLPPEHGVPLRLFLECALGAVFAALFVRRLGLDAFAAALGGMLYALTCLLGQSFWPPVVSTLVWLPAQLACVEALAQRWQWRCWLALVAATALQWLAGFPQFAFYGLHLVLPFALLRSLTHQGVGRGGWLRLAGIGAALGLGLGAAGAQLVPSLELVAQSARSDGLGADEVQYLGEAATSSATALRNALNPSAKLLAFDYGGGGSFFGFATLLLLGVGVLLGPPGLVALLLGIGALALLLSDGFDGPGGALYRLYAELPGAGAFRTPERLRILTLVGVITVACIGLDRLGRGRAGVSPWRTYAAVAITALAAYGIHYESGATLRLGFTFALVTAALLERRPLSRRVAQALLVVCALLELLHGTAPFGSFRRMPLEWSDRFTLSGYTVLDAAGLARMRADANGGRVEVEKALPATGGGALLGADHVACLEPLAPRAWRRLLRELPLSERNTLYDVASVGALLRPLRRDPAGSERLYAEFLDRYESGLPLLPGPPPGFEVRELQRPSALPRAYWIGRHLVRSQEQALGHIVRGDFDFHAAVLIERDPGDLQDPVLPLRPARIAVYEPERVEIEVDAPAAGLLVLTDGWYPGWRATRDGEALDVLRANGLFRAVRVPAGASRVRFDYQPESVRWGFALSAASLAAAVAVPLLARRERR